ncbi:MAG: type II secretion system F family protein, partial [Planctomycetota bacterium]
MPTFSYQGVLDNGQRVQGTLQSRDRREAVDQLLSRGCHPLQVDTAEGATADVAAVGRRLLQRIRATDLAVFTRQLASLLKAGLPVVPALRTLHKQVANRHLARISEEMAETLSREGGTLSEV